jgi:hypothetical protein
MALGCIVVSTAILHRSGDLVDSLRVYVDLAPVLAEPSTAMQEAR